MDTLRLSLAGWMLCIATASMMAQTTSESTLRVVRLDASLGTYSEEALKEEGIEILHYFGDQTYLLSAMPTQVKAKEVELASQRGSFETSEFASEQGLIEVDLVLTHAGAVDLLQGVLAKAGFLASDDQVKGGTTLSGTISSGQVDQLLASPYILNATPTMRDVVPYNFEARIAQAVTPLNSGIAGAPNLQGEGVVLGIGDGGQLSGHPDIGDRVIYSTTYYNSAWGSHPDMVAGIMASTGSVSSEQRGVACEAELVIEPSSAIIYWAPDHLTNYQMSITNNSYGPSFHCNTANKYYGVCASVDQQLFDNPSLMHVYAVGNSGTSSCNGMPTSHSTIPGGGQVAKNTLSVGNAKFDRTRYAGSSAGPTFDGRLKPEIMAVGTSVTSNNRIGDYGTGSGTSYSSPGVAATLGLLTQRYKDLSSGALPDGALLKALVCNTAEDIGPAGPDYKNGYGLINGVKALAAIENTTYHQGYLSTGSQYTHSVSTTATTERLKLMLYWPDQAGPTTNTSATLINDFDLKVVAPNGDTLRPWVLDPFNPLDLAVRGVDTLNNIEQVTIDNPSVGTYQLLVDGVDLPYGSTDYVLTWHVQQPEVMLTSPYGGESLIPGENMYVAWDASPGQTGTWKVEYSLDGASWSTVQAGISTASRHIVWAPPVDNTPLELRITNETSLLSDSTNEPAYVLGVPENVVSEPICDGDVSLQWSSVSGASSYEVLKFDGSEMVSVGTTADTFLTVSGLKAGIDSLFSITAVSATGQSSQRAFAVKEVSEIDGPDCYSPLPVGWLSIEVNAYDAHAKVEWAVASELNNERFEVLRSENGLDWFEIGRVNGRGTDPTSKIYSILDVAPQTGGSTYYRVKQVDYDGSAELSEIVVFVGDSPERNSLNSVSLIENPVKDYLELLYSNAADTDAVVYDVAGSAVHNIHLQRGSNTIPWPSKLGAGFYMLRVNTPSGYESMKLVKR